MRVRPRRNRKSASIRDLVEEVQITPSDLIAPFFIVEGEIIKDPIHSLPHQYRYSADELLREVAVLYELGIKGIALFPIIDPSLKDAQGIESYNPEGLVPGVISLLKKEIPELCIISDVSLDAYTSHGRGGIVGDNGQIDNDLTLEALASQALCHAEAGVDIIAPSDMMDGRVAYLRDALDDQGFSDVSLLSYTAKYASSLHRPYRNAIEARVAFSDTKTYQLNPANQREALYEAKLDEAEGADLLLIKPASLYLDVLAKIRAEVNIPVGAFHSSGEYAMVMAAEEKGLLSSDDVFYETLLSIKRAGADFVFSYAAKHLLKKLDLCSEQYFESLSYPN